MLTGCLKEMSPHGARDPEIETRNWEPEARVHSRFSIFELPVSSFQFPVRAGGSFTRGKTRVQGLYGAGTQMAIARNNKYR
jgi:hypothetical protein